MSGSYLGRFRPDTNAEITSLGALLPAANAQFVDLDTLLEQLASNDSGVYMPLDSRVNGKPIRLDLWASGRGSENNQLVEQLFLVRRTELDGFEILLERIATLTWTIGTLAVSGSPVADHDWCDTCAASATGLLNAKVRAEIETHNFAGSMATATIFDVGPAIGIVRNMTRTTASAALPYSALWS